MFLKRLPGAGPAAGAVDADRPAGPGGPFDWRGVFDRDAKRVVDLGCGNGRYLIASALARPECDHQHREDGGKAAGSSLRGHVGAGGAV